ncbi:hypothetical protein EMIHUDRAFT_468029 [Emiliania huxleyi CCMP1516]|uniref:Transmembrane 9 superfamily member n=2 Tax=Emiliania huxleyi TaxID=2903 RepID=A0A0D3K9I1_EMIH1|nr:hypothetical protein EMIHUDRAFT_468029 [Emiliania huxleyi CCMP1516]EOD32416.1 hypothetical protein EMIHUDRAFT_468029 [Emiliania huxleyi CCMP1516]|eukprot:XP_005784845.1 hypothetical protein EMIHUDRAFT_468029 [Emiliania huxleyi CCMP1516]
MSLVFLRVWLLLAPVAAFYLPGVAPHEYLDNEKVNKLSSTKTQLPYDYYSLPFCRPAEVVNKMENLGEVLHGSVIKNSAYDISMGKIEFRVLCKRTLEPAEATLLHTRIRQDYRVHMIMDNLPAATKMIRELPDGQTIVMYDRGYPLGFVGSAERQGSVPGGAYLHNHLRFVLKYHKDAAFDGARIVGFEVEPLSVKHKYKGAWSDDASQLQLLTLPVGHDSPPLRADRKRCGARGGLRVRREATGPVVYTYDVKWEPSDVKWASRWDLYLYMGDDQIHWFSIINSLAIVLLLTGIVAMIMMRTLRRDVSRYNSPEDKDDLAEATGPSPAPPAACSPTLLFVFSCYHPSSSSGGLLTATLLTFMLMGVPAGYCASHTYKALKGTEWKLVTVLTATLYPGAIAATLKCLIGQQSSGAIPFGTMVVLLLMWFGVSAKLKDPPCRTNEIPRQRFYYVFGFLALVLLILIITCAEISIVLCYFQLCNEDYNWWWRAFLTSGSSGLYLFGYSIMYFHSQLEIDGFVPTLMYFTYMAVFSTLFFLVTGTIGFYSCQKFVWAIYAAIKVD